MDQFECIICGKSLPENYCPECARSWTIDRTLPPAPLVAPPGPRCARPSLHKPALVIAGLHYLASLAMLAFAFATAWTNAASGRSGPGLFEFVFFIFQPLVMVGFVVELSVRWLFPLLVPSSLLYGYGIAYLLRRHAKQRKHDQD